MYVEAQKCFPLPLNLYHSSFIQLSRKSLVTAYKIPSLLLNIR